jgi:cellulose synthase operon protein C
MAPGHRLSLEALMTLAHYDGDQPRLLDSINQMLELFSDSPTWILQKSFCLEELAYRNERADLLQKMSDRQDSHPVFWQSYAQLLSDDARENQTAARLLKRAIKVMPGDAQSYYLLAHISWAKRQFADAAELYRFATCLDDKKLKYARSYFETACSLKQTDIALNLLTQRWKQYQTQSSQPAYALAWAYQRLNQPQDMFAVLRSAQAQHLDDGDLMLYRARLYTAYGDHETTALLLEQAKGKASDLAWLRMAAELAQSQGERSSALDLWQQVVKADPLSYEAHQAISKLLTESQGNAAAQDFLEQTCRQFPHSYSLLSLWYEQVDDENLEQAESVLRRIIDNNPVYAWARRQLAWQLGKQQRIEEAFTELAIAGPLDPHSAAYFRVQGQLLVLDNRPNEAKQAYRTSLSLSIDSEWTIRALLSLCQSQIERRASLDFIYQEMTRQVIAGEGLLMYRAEAASVLSAEELLASLRVGLEQRPDLWQAWSVVIEQLCVMEQLTEALALAKQATERFPLQVDTWLELAAVHEAQEEVAGELSALQQAVRLSPGSSYAVRQLADAYDRSGHLEASQAILEQAIVHAPLDYRNYGFLAQNQWQSGQQDAALLTIEKALRLEPDYDWAWAMLRQWSLELNQPQRPVELAQELTATRAGEAGNWFRLAELLTDSEHRPEQYAALEKAIHLNVRYLDAYDLKAKLLTAEQQYDDAIATLNAPIWGESLPTVVQGRIAWIEAQRGNCSTAIESMQATVAQEPDYYWGWLQLAEWYGQIGADADSLKVAYRLTELEPKDSTAWGYLGDAQLRTGDRATAKVTFKKALDLLPSYRYVGLSLFDLEIEDRQIQEATQTLTLLQTHYPDNDFVLARTVQLLALQGKQKQALACLQTLCLNPTENDWPLHAATKAVIEVGWTQTAQNLLHQNLSQSEAHPEVGACWVRCCIALNQWRECLSVLQALSLQDVLEQRASVYFLQEATELEQYSQINAYLKTSEQVLQRHSKIWGMVGYCLYRQGKYQRAIQWLSDWEQREAVESWMLINLVLALRQLNRHQEAVNVSKQAVKLICDSSSDSHRVWVAIDAARSGSTIQAARLLESINVAALHPSHQSLYYLVQALLETQAGQGSTDLRFQKARAKVQQASKAQPQLWSFSVFRDIFRRTVWWIAIKNLSIQSLLWAYWQCLKPCLTSEDLEAWSIEGRLTVVVGMCLFLLFRLASL